MPRPSKARQRSSSSERFFPDDAGRIWSVAYTRDSSEALVFVCITDAREHSRAVVADPQIHLGEADDEQLRRLLNEAPPLGRLS